MNTKKDYQRAANLVAQIDDKTLQQVAIGLFVRFFASDNPRFDQDRFVEWVHNH